MENNPKKNIFITIILLIILFLIIFRISILSSAFRDLSFVKTLTALILDLFLDVLKQVFVDLFLDVLKQVFRDLPFVKASNPLFAFLINIKVNTNEKHKQPKHYYQEGGVVGNPSFDSCRSACTLLIS